MTSKVQPIADFLTVDRKKTGDKIVSFLLSMKMTASRFRSLSKENTAQLLNDKDSENTKKSMKQHRLVFESYLKEKTSEILQFQWSWRQFYKSFTPRPEKKRWTDVLYSKKLSLFHQIFFV